MVKVLVRMLATLTGLRDRQPWPPPGSTVELPDAEAVALIRNGMVAPVYDPEHKVERAVPPAPETRRIRKADRSQ